MVGKALVVIAVELDGRKIGRIRMRHVTNASANSLVGFVRDCVACGSIVHTDGWKGYIHLNSLGYIHEVVRKDTDVGENLLPSCHRVASLLKRWLLGTHQGAVSPEHLAYYLDEYTFRFNRRTSTHRGKLFMRLLENAVKIAPVTHSQIIQHVRGRKPQNHKI